MADVNIDPFGEHDKTDLHPDDTSENIPLPPITPGGGSTCDHQVGYAAGGYSLSPRWFLTWYIYPFFQD